MADIYGGIMGGLALARQGAQEKKARGLAALVGQAYTAPREQRQGLLGQIASIDPGTASQTQASMGALDDSKQKALVRSAQMLLAAPEEARPQVWAQIVQAGEIPGLKPEYDPVKVPEMAQKIVSAFGQSSMPAELQTWGALTSGLSEADRQKALRVKLGLDPRAGLLDIGEYAGGVYGVNRDPNNVHAVPVPIGAPQPSGREVPFTIDPSLPPEIQADIRASEARGMPWEQGPQLQAAPKDLPSQSVTLSSDEVAQLGLPAGTVAQKDIGSGKITVVNRPPASSTSGPKPMPVRAVIEDLAIEDAIGASQKLADVIKKHADRRVSGDLKVSPTAVYGGRARTFFGMANDNDVNLSELKADMTAVVNDWLRLNKGVQTEGDAQRAFKELMEANDAATVDRSLTRLAKIIQDTVELQTRKRALLRQNYNGKGQPDAQTQADDDLDSLLDMYR